MTSGRSALRAGKPPIRMLRYAPAGMYRRSTVLQSTVANSLVNSGW